MAKKKKKEVKIELELDLEVYKVLCKVAKLANLTTDQVIAAILAIEIVTERLGK